MNYMNKPNRRHYPLQIAISTLFITVIIILGSILTLQNYNKTSDIILSSADQLYNQITRELVLDFNATYTPMAGLLQLVSLSTITQSSSLDERITHLKSFKAILQNNPSHFAAGIAFPDGDFFNTSLLNSQAKRDFYKAPAQASLMALHIDTDTDGTKRMTTLFYDDKLQEISRRTEISTFDTLKRPWYIQARNTPHATKPYLFHNMKVVGLTVMLKTSTPGVVVAIDVTLDNLSETISKYKITDNSEVTLINKEGDIFAYSKPEKVIIKSSDDKFSLASIKQLNSPVLTHISNTFKLTDKQLDFEFNNQQWTGSSKVIARPGGVDLYAVMVSPVDELLKEAATIKWQSLITTLVIILLAIPVVWLVAKTISTPLYLLAKEARNISRFKFSDSVRKQSFIKEVEELDDAMGMMKSTINKFIKLINSLAGLG